MLSQPIVLDSSVYIRELRAGNSTILGHRRMADGPIWLSAVVLEELFAGASNTKDVKILNKFEDEFSKIARLLTPNSSDWSLAGQILNKIGVKYGFDKIGKARLTNDTVLAMSVARNGMTLLTSNVKDFKLISEFREFVWELI